MRLVRERTLKPRGLLAGPAPIPRRRGSPAPSPGPAVTTRLLVGGYESLTFWRSLAIQSAGNCLHKMDSCDLRSFIDIGIPGHVS